MEMEEDGLGSATPILAPRIDLFRLQREQQEQLRFLRDVTERQQVHAPIDDDDVDAVGGDEPAYEDIIVVDGRVAGLRGLARTSGEPFGGCTVKVLFVEPGPGALMLRCKSLIHRAYAEVDDGDAGPTTLDRPSFELELTPPDTPEELGGDVLFVVNDGDAFFGQCVIPLADLFLGVEDAFTFGSKARKAPHVQHVQGWFPLVTRSGEVLAERSEIHIRVSVFVPPVSFWAPEPTPKPKSKPKLRAGRRRSRPKAATARPKAATAARARTAARTTPTVSFLEKPEETAKRRLREREAKLKALGDQDPAALDEKDREASRAAKIDLARKILEYERLRDGEIDGQQRQTEAEAAVLELQLKDKRIDAAVDKYSKALRLLLKEGGGDENDDANAHWDAAEADDDGGSEAIGTPELEEAYAKLRTQHLQLSRAVATHERRIKEADDAYRDTCSRIKAGVARQRRMFSVPDALERDGGGGGGGKDDDDDDKRLRRLRAECVALRTELKRLDVEEAGGLAEWQEREAEAESIATEVAALEQTLEERYDELSQRRFDADAARQRHADARRNDKESALRLHQDRLRHLLSVARDELWGGAR